MDQVTQVGDPANWYFRSPAEGVRRVLSQGVVTHVLRGEKLMLSFVEIEPHTASPVHSHPEEQWGYLLSGRCVRIQGVQEIEMNPGDFWCTPGGVPHAIRTGAHAARILDIFSPPRAPYAREGAGFGSSEADDAATVPQPGTADRNEPRE